MILADSLRVLRPVVEKREIGRDVIMQAIGQVILYTSSAQARLNEIKQIPVEEQES